MCRNAAKEIANAAPSTTTAHRCFHRADTVTAVHAMNGNIAMLARLMFIDRNAHSTIAAKDHATSTNDGSNSFCVFFE